MADRGYSGRMVLFAAGALALAVAGIALIAAAMNG